MILVGILLLIGLSLVSTVMTLIQQQIEALANVRAWEMGSEDGRF